MVRSWLDRARNERGQGTAEYALIMALVSIVVIVVLVTLGTQITNAFSNVVGVLAGSSAGLSVQP